MAMFVELFNEVLLKMTFAPEFDSASDIFLVCMATPPESFNGPHINTLIIIITRFVFKMSGKS